MEHDTGLPDFVADHFAYLVRGSPLARFGQITFYVSALALPVIGVARVPDLAVPGASAGSLASLVGVAILFTISFMWYLHWFQSRLERFQKERPASYSRWFGQRRRRLRTGQPAILVRLSVMQLRYLVFSRVPSSGETLALSMLLARRSW